MLVLMKTDLTAYKKSNDSKICPYCGKPNGSKMQKLIISGNRVFYVHLLCCREISGSYKDKIGTAAVLDWLEKKFKDKYYFNSTCEKPRVHDSSGEGFDLTPRQTKGSPVHVGDESK